MTNNTTTATKIYRNRFASMERQPCGGWIVFSEVAGLPICDGGDLCDGERKVKVYPTYAAAREVMVMLTERYKSISRGR
jgi:hypothetical protein